MDLTKRLPLELLSRIFFMVQADNPILRPVVIGSGTWSPRLPTDIGPRDSQGRFRPKLLNRRKLAWIRLITHVCGRWRSIALSTRALWTRPTVYLGLVWFEEMIRRSEDALLSLSSRECGLTSQNLPTRRYMAEMFTNIVKVHGHRVRNLKFESSHGIPFLLQSFQALAKFEMYVPLVDRGDFDIPAGPLDIFDGHAPCLRSFSISHRDMRYRQLPGHSVIWNNLQHLHLTLRGSLLETGSDSPILLVLNHAHELKTCTLITRCVHPHSDGQDVASECATCSQLVILPATVTQFEVRGCTHLFAHFLAHVRLHPETNVHIHSTCPRQAEAPAIPYLKRALELEHRRLPSLRAVAMIEIHGNDRLELCSSSSPNALLTYHRLRDGIDSVHNTNDIQFTLELDSAHIRELLAYLSNTLILTMTTWQSSSQQMCDSFPFTRMDLLPFDHVRHLTLSCTNLHAIILLLEVPENGESSTIVFPSLTSLSIGGHGIWDFISSKPDPIETRAARLRRALCSRARAGKPVSSVFVHIKEELEEVRAGNWDRTSCSKYLKNVETIVREGLEELFAIDGLRVVSYNSVYVLNEDGLTGRLVERSV